MVKYGKLKGKSYDRMTLVLNKRHGEILRKMAEAEGITVTEKLRRLLEPWLKQIESTYGETIPVTYPLRAAEVPPLRGRR